MSYDWERLIAAREGPNNRRAFDEVRLLYKQNAVGVDAFFSSPVEVDQGQFDDQNVRDVWFWGYAEQSCFGRSPYPSRCSFFLLPVCFKKGRPRIWLLPSEFEQLMLPALIHTRPPLSGL